MKKKTLNQTWVLCLRMWRHVAKVWIEDGISVEILKMKWLNENGFGEDDILSSCFFCEHIRYIVGCYSCPGRMVDPKFDCERPEYRHWSNPPAFYRELLRLNRIRKALIKSSKK